MSLAGRIRPNVGKSIVILDIERLPGLASVPFWTLGDYKNRRIHADLVTRWPRIICLAWADYGNKKVNFVSEWEHGREAMLKAAHDVYDRAELLVGHNLKSFDTKHLRGEWLEMGLTPPRPFKVFDTLAEARKHFSFESNTLDALCRRLGVAHKEGKYNAQVAEDAVNGNKRAQRELKAYNVADIHASEALYDKLIGWAPNHPHVGACTDERICNQCGSLNLARVGSTRAVLIDYALYRCDDCGANIRAAWEARAARTRGAS